MTEFDETMLNDLLKGVASAASRVTTYLEETDQKDMETMMMIEGRHAMTSKSEMFVAFAIGEVSSQLLKAAYKAAEGLKLTDSDAELVSAVDGTVYMDKDGNAL